MSVEFLNGAGATEDEINEAQFALDHHPARSPFWDSRQGQDVLEVAHIFHLKPATDESFRRQWHARQMREARERLTD